MSVRILEEPLRKHSVVLHGRPTSISIQDGLWEIIKRTAAERKVQLRELIFDIDTRRRGEPLSRVAREFALTQMALSLSPSIAADDFEKADQVYNVGARANA